jgi:hypothetical protein
MHGTCLKAFSVIVLPAVWLTACASSPSRSSVPIAGGQSVALPRQGTGFKPAENDRVILSDPSLQAVNLDGKYYLRWSFAIRPKHAAELSTVRIEDVSDPVPLLLVNAVSPQLDAGQWTENAGLMDLPSSSVRWLFEPKETERIFRFTISEPDGQSYVLYQGVQYSPASKESLRAMVQ